MKQYDDDKPSSSNLARDSERITHDNSFSSGNKDDFSHRIRAFDQGGDTLDGDIGSNGNSNDDNADSSSDNSIAYDRGDNIDITDDSTRDIIDSAGGNDNSSMVYDPGGLTDSGAFSSATSDYADNTTSDAGPPSTPPPFPFDNDAADNLHCNDRGHDAELDTTNTRLGLNNDDHSGIDNVTYELGGDTLLDCSSRNLVHDPGGNDFDNIGDNASSLSTSIRIYDPGGNEFSNGTSVNPAREDEDGADSSSNNSNNSLLLSNTVYLLDGADDRNDNTNSSNSFRGVKTTHNHRHHHHNSNAIDATVHNVEHVHRYELAQPCALSSTSRHCHLQSTTINSFLPPSLELTAESPGL